MPQNIVEVPGWDTPLTAPGGGDPRTSAGMLAHLQKIANRLAFIKDPVPVWARARIAPSTVLTMAYYTLSLTENQGGYTLPSATELQVPSPGVYSISVSLCELVQSATAEVLAIAWLYPPPIGAIATRFGTNALGGYCNLACSAVHRITTPASQRIRLQNGSTQSVTPVDTYNLIHVHRIGS